MDVRLRGGWFQVMAVFATSLVFALFESCIVETVRWRFGGSFMVIEAVTFAPSSVCTAPRRSLVVSYGGISQAEDIFLPI